MAKKISEAASLQGSILFCERDFQLFSAKFTVVFLGGCPSTPLRERLPPPLVP